MSYLLPIGVAIATVIVLGVLGWLRLSPDERRMMLPDPRPLVVPKGVDPLTFDADRLVANIRALSTLELESEARAAVIQQGLEQPALDLPRYVLRAVREADDWIDSVDQAGSGRLVEFRKREGDRELVVTLFVPEVGVHSNRCVLRDAVLRDA